jgi:WhiB family transcriptional regulator, redox-sensing transcriptional regulator
MTDLQQRAREVMGWRTRAACLHADLELFFPEHTVGPAVDGAKQICGGCPVRARCLDWALSHGAAFGIWGGRTETERHAMRRIRLTVGRMDSRGR